MKRLSPARIFFLALPVALFLLTLPGVSHAIRLNVPFPLPGGTTKTEVSEPREYIQTIYLFALGAGAVLAMGMIVFGALQYTLSAGNIGRQQGAVEKIRNAIFGLILLLGVVFLINFLNPNILNPSLESIAEPPRPPSRDAPPAPTGFALRSCERVGGGTSPGCNRTWEETNAEAWWEADWTWSCPLDHVCGPQVVQNRDGTIRYTVTNFKMLGQGENINERPVTVFTFPVGPGQLIGSAPGLNFAYITFSSGRRPGFRRFYLQTEAVNAEDLTIVSELSSPQANPENVPPAPGDFHIVYRGSPPRPQYPIVSWVDNAHNEDEYWFMGVPVPPDAPRHPCEWPESDPTPTDGDPRWAPVLNQSTGELYTVDGDSNLGWPIERRLVEGLSAGQWRYRYLRVVASNDRGASNPSPFPPVDIKDFWTPDYCSRR